jgi:hypothetical protein
MRAFCVPCIGASILAKASGFGDNYLNSSTPSATDAKTLNNTTFYVCRDLACGSMDHSGGKQRE